MDDILEYGKSVGERNQHLEATLHKLQEASLTLNEEKCEFSKPSVEFPGILIDSEGVHVSPKIVEAILKMKTPQDQTELTRFLGVVNPFLSKGFPIDEQNRLALDRVKSISALSAHSAVKGLTLSRPRGSPLTSKVVWR